PRFERFGLALQGRRFRAHRVDRFARGEQFGVEGLTLHVEDARPRPRAQGEQPARDAEYPHGSALRVACSAHQHSMEGRRSKGGRAPRCARPGCGLYSPPMRTPRLIRRAAFVLLAAACASAALAASGVFWFLWNSKEVGAGYGAKLIATGVFVLGR